MKLMDKIRDIFTEEVEEEPIKKEVIQVEIPSPVEEIKEVKKEIVEVKNEEKPQVVERVIERIIERPVERQVERPVEKVEPKPEKREDKFVFPVYFDEKDFSTISKSREEKQVKEPYKANTVEPYKGKSITSVEKKVFKPTPIISPVYGVLDKNYSKEDITTKNEIKKINNNINKVVDSLDVDLVRNKAFGTLEDEVEDNLYVNLKLKNPSLEELDNIPVRRNDDMEEYRRKLQEVDEAMENDDLALDELERNINRVVMSRETNIVDEALEIQNEQKEEPKIEKEEKKEEIKAEENESITETDLFNMIDSMYEEGN